MLPISCPTPPPQMPMDNREVHEARCGRASTPASPLQPPPPPPSSGVFDPETGAPSDNVFTQPAATAAENQRPTPPEQRRPSPWREVDVPATAAAERRRQQLARLRAAQQVQEQYRARDRERARGASSSSSSSSSGNDSRETATRGARPAGAAGAAGGGGGSGAATTSWACTACTFLNDPSASRCEMCGTSVPPEHRPPDRSFRDTLIGGDVSQTGGGGGGPRRRRRPAGAFEDFEAAAEEARCRLAAAGGGSGGAVRTTGAGRVDEDLHDAGGGAMSGAAAGSAIGALGAGLLSAAQPGARPGRVFASMLQGAFMGGVAGAALGGGIGDDPGSRGGGTNPEDPRRQTQRQPSLEFVSGPSGGRLRRAAAAGGGGADPELESGMVARRLEALTLHQALPPAMWRQRMLGVVEEPRGIMLRVPRRGHHHGGGGGGDGSARPASNRAISALPEETLTNESLSHLTEDGRQCCICLEDFSASERATRLPCLHLYHTVCIEDWLHKSGTCPQCKHRVD